MEPIEEDPKEDDDDIADEHKTEERVEVDAGDEEIEKHTSSDESENEDEGAQENIMIF